MSSKAYVKFSTRDGRTVRAMKVSLEKYPDSFLAKYASFPTNEEEIPIDLDFNTLNNILDYISYNIPVDDRIKAIMDYMNIPHEEEKIIVHPNESSEVTELFKKRCTTDRSVCFINESIVLKMVDVDIYKHERYFLNEYVYIENLRKHILKKFSDLVKIGDRMLLIYSLTRKHRELSEYIYIDISPVLMTHFNSLPFFKKLRTKSSYSLNTFKETGTEFHCLVLNFEFVEESYKALTEYIEYCYRYYAK